MWEGRIRSPSIERLFWKQVAQLHCGDPGNAFEVGVRRQTGKKAVTRDAVFMVRQGQIRDDVTDKWIIYKLCAALCTLPVSDHELTFTKLLICFGMRSKWNFETKLKLTSVMNALALPSSAMAIRNKIPTMGRHKSPISDGLPQL